MLIFSTDTESVAYHKYLCTHNYLRLDLTPDGPREAPTGTLSVPGLNIRVMVRDHRQG